MIYRVTIQAPAIDDDVTIDAQSEEQAREIALANAIQRQAAETVITVAEVP